MNKISTAVSLKDVINPSIIRINPPKIAPRNFPERGTPKCNLTAAMYWHGYGLNVIPTVPDTKQPAVKWDPWLDNLGPQKIIDHWTAHPDHELGFIVGEELIVFDADSPESLSALTAIETRFELASKLVIKTSKGEHHYYRLAAGTIAKSDSHSTEKYPDRLDIKTGRALVILPPSPGKSFISFSAENKDELSEATQEFIDAINQHNGRIAPSLPREPLPQGETGNTSFPELEALLNTIDPDRSYDDWLRVGMGLFHETKGSDEGMALFDRWSSKGNKYKGTKDIEAKWSSFRSGSSNPVTKGTLIKMAKDAGADVSAIMGGFEPCECEVIPPTRGTPVPVMETEKNPLATLQKQFGLINMSGKIWVFDRKVLGSITDQGIAKKLTLSSRNDGELLMVRVLKAQHPQVEAASIVKQFWVSPNTICYGGVEFNPEGTSGNYLNLWVGPTITPKTGQWTRIQAFLLEIICDGDQEAYNYLTRYMAHALQRPEEKPGVMIILLGGQGIGKGTLGRILQRIWSATYIQVTDINSVTGNFNAALERSFLVFMDEALFSGNRRGSDALKSLVTEPYIQINEKHQPSRQIKSYHRFIAATNAEHFKNTERDDRRDFTLRVSESRKGDHAYWDELNQEIVNGGVEALANDLLAMDLSGFNVRRKPNTKEFLEQKLLSLDPIPRWWHECLCLGALSEDGTWPDFIATNNAIAGILEVAGGRIYRRPDAREVSSAMVKLCPSAKAHQKQSQFNRHRGFLLPSVQQARSEFELYIGGAVQWPEES